jgi:hypothetical protein
MPSYPAGSAAAKYKLNGAFWPAEFSASIYSDNPDTSIAPLAEDAWKTHDVVCLSYNDKHTRFQPEWVKRINSPETRETYWTARHLEAICFERISRSTVVMEDDGTLIAVFTVNALAPDTIEQMAAAFAVIERCYTRPQRCVNGIWMHGTRICPHTTKASATLDGGYYATKAPFSPADRALLIDYFGALTAAEKRIAPSIAAWKLETAERVGFPGIFPGVPLEAVSAHSVGLTRGYISKLHEDKSSMETIFWDSKGVGDADYCFTIIPCGLIFDLRSARSTSIIFPAYHPHGSLHCAAQPHHGLGAALIIKRDMMDPKNQEKVDQINARLAEIETANPGALRDTDAAFISANFKVSRPTSFLLTLRK